MLCVSTVQGAVTDTEEHGSLKDKMVLTPVLDEGAWAHRVDGMTAFGRNDRDGNRG